MLGVKTEESIFNSGSNFVGEGNLLKALPCMATQRVGTRIQHPLHFWKLDSNVRNFLEQVKDTCDVQKPSDWGRIKTKDIQKLGGTTLLNRYHRGSLFSCLKSVYKGFTKLR